MIFEVFLLFSPLFWVLGGLTFFGLIWAVSHEETSGRHSSMIFGIYVGMLILFGDFRPWEWVAQDPIGFAWKTGAYIGIGFVWSCVYWGIRCLNKRKEYNNDLKDWLIEHGIAEENIASVPDVPSNLKKAWTTRCKESFNWGATVRYNDPEHFTTSKKIVRIVPRVRDNKAEFAVAWLVWPASMFWSLFDDILKAVGHAMYDWFGGRLQAIANMAFRGTETHFEDEEPVVPADESQDEEQSDFDPKRASEWSRRD